jgi:glycosyltransferase involved in cell wall biosynthesis
MKVTHVAPTAFGSGGLFGGGERYPLELARALAREVPCRLVTFGRAQRRWREVGGLEVVVLRARAHLHGHPAHPLGTGLVRSLGDADVAHAHQLHSIPTRLAVVSARARGQPRVVTDHGLLGPDRGGLLPRLVDRFLTVSRYSAEVLGASPHRVRLIYGGADPERFHPEPDARRAGVVFVGRLTPHKGVDRLLRALPVGAELTVAGSDGHDPRGPERGYPQVLRTLAASAAGRVTFAGAVSGDELPRLLRRSAVLALPSVDVTCYGRPVRISELLGLVVLEAMASGTPVVCSRLGGIPEVVVDGETGFLVPPGDVGALHGRLAQLLGDQRLRARMGCNARELVTERFTWSACAQRCLASYAELLDGRDQAPPVV